MKEKTLSEKRTELVKESGKWFAKSKNKMSVIFRIFLEIKKQDKEFIKILKEKEIIKKYGSIDIVKTGTVKIEDIDKLTGDLG